MNIPPRNSMESVMEKLMGSHYDFDLTYITERIISVLYLSELDEQQYRANLKEVASMLKSKHQDKFLLINLSEKRHDICRLNPKVEEFGWPDLHAPPLDKICSVCKTMENWLNSDPRNVVVLHCKGNRGKTGVIVAAYMHYSKISAGADQALSTVAMRKFCEDKISSFLHPSQNRYIYYFAGLLSGAIKMNSSPLFLQQILFPVLLNYQSGGGYSAFLKIYQSMKLVYCSSEYDLQNSNSEMLCVNIEPALLLKGDILVKCYRRLSDVCKRECVFRVQFHTCSVHGSQLTFDRGELDQVCTADNFPADAKVELMFSSGPQKRDGEVHGKVHVDYTTTDPVVRWDSYENFNLHHEDSVEDICHTRGPLDGSLYAQVKKRRPPVSSSSECQTSTPLFSSTPPVLLSIKPLSLSTSQSSAEPESLSVLSSEKRDNKEKHRETAILDDGSCSPLRPDRPVQSCYGRPYSHTHSFCSPEGTSQHAHPPTVQPKHHTLPCSRAAPLSAQDLCVSQPDLLWQRGHCLHHPCPETIRHLYSYPSQEMYNHAQLSQSSHSHTLPPQTRGLFPGESCALFHYSAFPQSHAFISPSLSPNQPLISSPYRELCFNSTPPTSCSCRDCTHLREDVALHSLQGRELENLPWSREAEFGIRRKGPMPFRDGRVEGVREAESWCRKISMSPSMLSYGHCQAVPKQDHAVCITEALPPLSPFPSPQSSGYHSPHPQSPCSPQLMRDSPGYASISQSQNSSPIALTPSPKRPNSHSKAPSEDNRHDLNDGCIKIVDDENSLDSFSSSSHNSKPVDVSKADQSKPQEAKIATGPLITVSAENGAEVKKTSTDSVAPKTPIVQQPMPKGVESVHVQTHDPRPPTAIDRESELEKLGLHGPYYSLTIPQPPHCSSGRSSASDFSSLMVNTDRQNSEENTNSELTASTPDQDGYITPSFPLASHSYPLLTVPHVPYTGYTEITIPAFLPHPLPEKQRSSPLQILSEYAAASSEQTAGKSPTSAPEIQVFSTNTREPTTSTIKGAPSSGLEELESRLSSKFVQDSSKYWYKPGISRDQDKEPGCFIIRDSNSFQGAYGLALKVSTPPAHVHTHTETGSPQEQLVRHFLIESGAKGVKIKGCHNETYFGSLSALVYHHSINPVSLPCILRIPDRDLVGELQEIQSGTNTSTAADLLKQGAACNVLYLNSVETESLTGPQAVSKATKCTLTQEPRSSPTVVHFKVSTQGITLTDNQRRWADADNTSCKMFGFVARRSGTLGNVCHLFAELDPEQPATAIVNFINKVMLGPQQLRK
ncbi:hypothetical protein DNTS_021020 [Danionella cerebrum]|uniref:SH2 domain-containing protein n=1 Tax=Danionella cerebrum TaxID=2873325 RepID=A0A553Q7R9_9TELE|nr:hypothetical protein DNTS_021020 [Danionella translucida]